MMRQLGFAENWIAKVMTCISIVTVSYAALINEMLGQVIKPTRGIRQVDPISPYLYLICAKGLSSLLQVVDRCSD